MKFLEESLVSLDIEASNPIEAIRESGKLLEQAQLIESQYIDAMVQSFETNGPYFVLAPNIALPHARPEDGVKEAAVSFIRLKEPIRFGHSSNDPVQLVFALAASTSEEHLDVLKKLMQLLSESNNITKLLKVRNYQEIKQLIGGNE